MTIDISQIKLVILESPFAGDVAGNLAYACEAARDCALRGESPAASHLLFPTFLDDRIEEERQLGIALGLAWRHVADFSVFYTDRGWSRGMLAALESALDEGRPFRLRALHSPPRLPAALPSELFKKHRQRLLDGIDTVELKAAPR